MDPFGRQKVDQKVHSSQKGGHQSPRVPPAYAPGSEHCDRNASMACNGSKNIGNGNNLDPSKQRVLVSSVSVLAMFADSSLIKSS